MKTLMMIALGLALSMNHPVAQSAIPNKALSSKIQVSELKAIRMGKQHAGMKYLLRQLKDRELSLDTIAPNSEKTLRFDVRNNVKIKTLQMTRNMLVLLVPANTLFTDQGRADPSIVGFEIPGSPSAVGMFLTPSRVISHASLLYQYGLDGLIVLWGTIAQTAQSDLVEHNLSGQAFDRLKEAAEYSLNDAIWGNTPMRSRQAIRLFACKVINELAAKKGPQQQAAIQYVSAGNRGTQAKTLLN